MTLSLSSAIARFGAEAKAKLANPSASGEPEDQLRAPLETLFADLTELCGLPRNALAAVGESALAALKTRPDYAITVRNVLVGFVEVKAPGKGADPRRYRGHDREQWDRLQSLPNLLYTDGNAFGLWRNGELTGGIVRLHGDIESAGSALAAPTELLGLFDNFLRWEPIPPRSARELAEVSARLCRLLRDEVTEQLALGTPALTALAADWRTLLFPEANDAQFADGYAQAVTFGLLMARARDIRLADGLELAGRQLSRTNSLIGTALKLLTDDAGSEQTLKTSLGALTRVLDAVNWQAIGKGDADAWLYFYEDFLAVYDNALRKLTGSYYTPPEVVGPMVRLVDDVLRRRFGQTAGLASPTVTLADPAVGTGTFLLGVLRQIAGAVAADQGEGAAPEAVEAAISRLIAFEMQLGPFAVAQLRIHAELLHLIGHVPRAAVRMFVTDTLDNPYIEQRYLPHMVEPIAASRRQANEIKKAERITVVLGNPPYKEKAKGRGGWVEPGNPHSGEPAILQDWLPPADWGVGAHAKHLRNLYVYFWRWATWKVFDQHPTHNTGVVCFITVAGFLNGPGFQRMRDYCSVTGQLKHGILLAWFMEAQKSQEGVMEKRYRVTLMESERDDLRKLVSVGKSAAAKLVRARILLLADQAEGGPAKSDAEIVEALGCGRSSVERLRKRFVEESLEAALTPKPSQRVFERKMDGKAEAQLIALACSAPPEGRARWTLRLLSDRLVTLEDGERVSYETVRRTLKKTSLSLG